MADIVISRKIRPCPGLSIAETMSPSLLDIIETVTFNPTDYMSKSSDVIETVTFNPTDYMSFTDGIQETASFNPVESMTYTN